MEKETLTKEREIPMKKKEDNDDHLYGFIIPNKDRGRGRLKRKIPPMVSRR